MRPRKRAFCIGVILSFSWRLQLQDPGFLDKDLQLEILRRSKKACDTFLSLLAGMEQVSGERFFAAFEQKNFGNGLHHIPQTLVFKKINLDISKQSVNLPSKLKQMVLSIAVAFLLLVIFVLLLIRKHQKKRKKPRDIPAEIDAKFKAYRRNQSQINKIYKR